MQTYSLEKIKQLVIDKGGEPLFEEFINVHTPLKIKVNNKIIYKTANNILRLKSNLIDTVSTAKPELERVKKLIIDKGGEPLFDKYINSREPLKIKTIYGDIIYKSYFELQRIKKSLNDLNTPNKIKQFLEKRDEAFLGPLDKEIISATEKLDVQCNKRHVYHPTWNNISNGSRCPFCAGNIKHDINKIKDAFIQKGYKPLFNTYINANSSLEVICPHGKVIFMKYAYLQQEGGCGCHKKPTYSTKELIKSIENEGYRLIENLPEFIYFTETLIQAYCPKGTLYKFTAYSWIKEGHRCKCCKGLNSMDFENVKNLIES